jgi:hypothetical protein
MYRGLVGLRGWSGRGGEEKKISSLYTVEYFISKLVAANGTGHGLSKN